MLDNKFLIIDGLALMLAVAVNFGDVMVSANHDLNVIPSLMDSLVQET